MSKKTPEELADFRDDIAEMVNDNDISDQEFWDRVGNMSLDILRASAGRLRSGGKSLS